MRNTINFEDTPNEQYGKVMSLPDKALMEYLELATDLPDEDLAAIRNDLEAKPANAMNVKKRLAREIVAQFHGKPAADEADGEFQRVFQKQKTPQEMNEISAAEIAAYATEQSEATDAPKYDLPHLLHDKGLVASVTEARRLIKQGAVQVIEGPGQGAVTGASAELGAGSVLKFGKHRFLRIVDSDV